MPGWWTSPRSKLKVSKAPSGVTGERQETLPSRDLGTKTQPPTQACSPGSGTEGPGKRAWLHPTPSYPVPSQGRG